MIELIEPKYLWLLVAVPLLFVVPRPTRDPIHALLRALVLAALALAIARPVRLTADEHPHHVLVIDRSESVTQDPARTAAALDALRSLRGSIAKEARAHLVSIGEPISPDDAILVGVTSHQHLGHATDTTGIGNSDGLPAANTLTQTTLTQTTPTQTTPTDGGRRTSPLSDAIRLAGSLIPQGAGGAITIVSDGLSTDRRFATAAQSLSERQIPVHAVPIPAANSDVRPVSLTTDAPLRVGHTGVVRVEIVGPPSVCDITLHSGNQELARLEGLTVDGRATAELRFEPDAAGFLSVTADVAVTSGVDSRDDDNALTKTLSIQDPYRALYLGQRMQGGGARMSELLGNGFSLDEREPVSEEGAGPIDRYDVVILDDRPAATVPEPLQQEILQSVREDGVGLVFSGGSGSFGPGGWHETLIETAIPVELIQKEEKRDPSTTLVVIIDTSGSMGGERVQLAKEVARLSMSRLLPHDKVGIVEFYGAKRWAAPIQPASNAIDLQRALNRLDAGGGTVILPAIEEAFYGLQNVRTRYKHVLILTDGGVETGAFEPLLRKMAEKGVNSSTVLIGSSAHSEFLVSIANWGKGRFYSVPNRFNLPEILLKQPASARLPAYRPGVHAVLARGGPGYFGEVDVTAIPDLAGYVETRTRPGAEVLIETADGAHPVLATWGVGLGRVTAMTTEPVGPGTAPWRDWEGYGTLLTRVLSRTAADARAPFHYEIERRDHRVIVTATRRVGANSPTATLLSDTGESPTAELAFRAIAPDRFVTSFVANPGDPIRVIAGSDAPGRPPTRLALDPWSDIAPELQVDPSLGLRLDALAEATGGSVTTLNNVGSLVPTASTGSNPERLIELRPLAFLLAIVFYLLDLLWRRRDARPISAGTS